MDEAGIHLPSEHRGHGYLFSSCRETSINIVGRQVDCGGEGTTAFERDLGSMDLQGFAEG